MAERNPTFTPAITSDTIDYKPMSLLAVAGLVVSSLYAAFVLLSAVIALVKGQPFFVPGWMFFVPVLGAVLSAAGLWEINSAEGTKAGTKVAKWGLWLSLLVGIGYFTYQTFTGLAIVQQASHFVMQKDAKQGESGFFPLIQSDRDVDLDTAFLFTVNWAERSNAQPGRPQGMAMLDQPSATWPKGRWTQFLESHLVRLLRQSPPSATKIEELGVTEWSYEQGSYKIVRPYRITTPDGVYEIVLIVSSQEAEAEGERRRWKIDFNSATPLVPSERTAEGLRKKSLREHSFDFLHDPKYGFFDKLAKRQPVGAWLATQMPSERMQLEERAGEVLALTPLVLAAGGAAAVDLNATQHEGLLEVFLPGYKPLAKAAEYFQNLDGFRISSADYRARVQALALQALTPEKLGLHPFKELVFDETAPIQMKNGEILISHPFEILLNLEDPKAGSMGIILHGKAVLAASDKLDPSSATADQEWRVARVEFVRATPLPAGQSMKAAAR